MFIGTSLEMFWTYLCTGNSAKLAIKIFFFYIAYKVETSRENVVTKTVVHESKILNTTGL